MVPVTFGRAEGADIRLLEAQLTEEATAVQASLRGRPWSFRIGAPGAHLAENAVGALAAAEAAGADPARAGLALGQWSPPEGRGVRTRILLGPDGLDGAIDLLDESFNANPTSVRAALGVLGLMAVEDDIGRIARGRRLAFLGDMLELGPEERAMHAGLADAPEMAAVDLVFCCGERMRALFDALPREKRGAWFPDSEALAIRAQRTVDAGDVCMVKGSKAARMGVVVEAIRRLGTPETPGDAGGTG
jgi:UDP-N-acetylmuramoyl-tripeptide--D-alanyl-D-alanine ligase